MTIRTTTLITHIRLLCPVCDPAPLLHVPLWPRRGRLAVTQLQMQAEAGVRGEGAVTGTAGEGTLPQVHTAVGIQLCGDAKRLTAIGAAVASCL